ncbi:MAG: CBS domain-containing protein [Bacteroidota bacterium]
MEIIATHAPVDFDGLASMVAARHLFPGAVLLLGEDVTPSVAAFLQLYQTEWAFVAPKDLPAHSVHRVILVDTQARSRVEGLNRLLAPEVEWLAFDHHPPTHSFEGGEVRALGAATTLVVGRLQEAGIPLSPLEASLCLIGIYQDTGHLTYGSTQPEDARAVARLLEWGGDLNMVLRFSRLSGHQSETLEELLDHALVEDRDGMRFLFSFCEHESGEGASSAVDQLAMLHHPDLTLAAIRIPEETLLVARSNRFDLRPLLLPFGGKGHPGAMSARTPMPPRDALEALKDRLPSIVPPPMRAQDLMSSPVRTIEASAPIRAALERLLAFGHGALVVTEKTKPLGVVSRKELELALRHGLAEEAVGGIIERALISVPPDAPLPLILQRMAKQGIGRVLVMEEGRLLGIVSRSDVIWALETHPHFNPPQDLWPLLEMTWPASALGLLREGGAVAGDQSLFLVGGAVRDLLLGRPNLDLDLVVEGDAIQLAQEWAGKRGYPVKTHPPFGTACLFSPEGEIDLATARLEYYEQPNALPVVEPATIRQDLGRRDFSINAMAVRIAPHPGELVDPFEGRLDLERKVLRVLHRLSFLEDPTRILRGIRFNARLGFRFEETTESQARYAASRLGEIGGERFKRELCRILEEGQTPKTIPMLFALGAERLLAANLSERPPIEWRAFERLRRCFQARFEGRYWLSGLALLLSPLPLEKALETAGRLLLGEKEIKILREALEGKNRLPNLPKGNSARLQHFRECGPEAMLFLAVVAPDERKSLLDLAFRLRKIALTGVSGYTLKNWGVPPGPVFREILDEVLAAKLDGKIASPDEEIMLARTLAEPWIKEPP